MIARLPRRRPKGRLFTESGRHLLLLMLAAAASIAALGMLTDHSLLSLSPSVTAQAR